MDQGKIIERMYQEKMKNLVRAECAFLKIGTVQRNKPTKIQRLFLIFRYRTYWLRKTMANIIFPEGRDYEQ